MTAPPVHLATCRRYEAAKFRPHSEELRAATAALTELCRTIGPVCADGKAYNYDFGAGSLCCGKAAGPHVAHRAREAEAVPRVYKTPRVLCSGG